MSDLTIISVRLALTRARLAITKAAFGSLNRWPAGSSKGGQFAPKGGSGVTAPQLGLPGGSTWKESGWAGSGMWSKPKAPPPGFKPHPSKDDKGNPVHINHPTPASPADTWSNPKAVATFTPGGNTPQVLNGVPFKSWTPPKEGWASVKGTNEKLDQDFPFEPHPTKHTGAGVIIVEPDGRLWLTKPTNEFGGYKHTFPKGTAESGLTMQQNAIKEAYEETGLKVQILGIAADIERDTSKARYYFARRVGGTPRDMGWESQALRLSPRKQALDLLNKPHDKTLLADALNEMDIRKAAGQPSKANSTGKPGAWQFQERWPGGSALGGQWKATGADGITAPPKIAGGLTSSNSVYQKVANAVHDAAQAGDVSVADKAVVKYVDSTIKFKVGVKTSQHIKWGAQVAQYAAQVKSDLKAKTTATATADKLQGPQKLSAMTAIGGKPGGSNPGGLYQDAGGKWLVKGSNADDATPRSQNEVLASKLMAAVGVGAPEMKLVDLEGKHGGGIGVASKWIDGAAALNPMNAGHVAAAQADFAVHAWLANYDVLGLGMDNTMIVGGKAVNIDPGGALLYRAQGQPKGDKFTNKADEFDSMRNPSINPNGAKIYGSMTASQLAASADKLKRIDDATIGKLVQTYGPGTDYEKGVLTAKLIARKADILQRVAALNPPAASTIAYEPGAYPKYGVVPKEVAMSALQAAGYKFSTPKNGLINYSIIVQGGIKHGTLGAGDISNDLVQMMLAQAKTPIPNLNAINAGMLGGGKATPAPAPTPAATAAQSSPMTVKAEKLTFVSGGSDKFWQVAVVGTKVVTQWGKNGTEGKQTFKEMGKVSAAVKEAEKLYQSKKAKGYVDSGFADMKVIAPGAAPSPARAASTPKPEPLAPVSVIAKPTAWPNGGAAAFYNGLTDRAQALHAKGDLAGLEAMKFKPNGDPIWSATANGKLMGQYHAALVVDLEKKQAAQTMATVAAAQAAVSQPVAVPANGTAPNGVPMPNFAKFKLPESNSNAPSHNAKVDKIADLAGKGDIKGLLSLNYGTNNYAKKQVQLANDALKALGSPHSVSAGQKQNAHWALLGGVAPQKVQQAAAATGQQPPTPHPATTTKPNLHALDTSKATAPPKPFFDKSSKAHVNNSNNKVAAEIAAKFAAGDYLGLQAMKYDVLDKESGQLLGIKHLSEHPAKDLKGYYDAALTVMREVAYPPKPLKVFQAQHAETVKAISDAFPSKPFGTTVDKVSSNEKVGFWVAIGKVESVAMITPSKTVTISAADAAKAHTDYETKANKRVKAFINGIQASGSYNDLFRDGHTHDSAGNKLADVAQAALDYAQAKPAGTRITRWQHMSADMIQKLQSSGPGTVLQATGPMCCSKSDTATSGFGPHRITVVYADGAKAVDSFGSGAYKGEQEVTTLPNARFVVLQVGKQSNGNSDVTLLMLPPDLGIKKP